MPTEATKPLERSQQRFTSWQFTVLGAMYVGYAAFMLCRNTLIASSAEMISDPALDMDKESFGRLMSWHSAGAICGKLVTGPGADWLGGRRMFLIALSLTAIANVGFAFGSSFAVFAAFNFLGQFAKSGGWPAMTKMVSQWYPEHRYGAVWSVISTSSRVGTIAAGLFLGFLLSLVGWREVFWVSALLTGGVVVGLLFFLKETPQRVGLLPLADHQDDELEEGPIEEPPHPFDTLGLPAVCRKFAASGRFWSICFSLFFLTIMMDFLVFIPIYLKESLGISSSQASMAGSAFPAGMFAALILTGFVYDRLTKLRLIWTLGSLLTFSCLCVAVLWNLKMVPEAVRTGTAITTIFLMGLSLSPAYYIPMSVFSVAFGGKHSGFLVALIDVFGYAGAMAFNYFGGTIATDFGWSVFLMGLLAIAVLATTCMVTFLGLDWSSERKTLKNEALSG